MKFMSVQFHAEPRELIVKVLELAREFNLLCVSGEIKAQRIVDMHKELSVDMFQVGDDFRYIMVLFERDLNEVINVFSDLLSIKKEGICIEIGALSVNGLMESLISFSKNDIQYVNVAPQKVFKKLKDFTSSGAIAFNIKTGTENISRSHRYTVGAKALYDSGVKIIPFGGGKTVFFKLP